jgi:RNA polymerase primary sigma factor
VEARRTRLKNLIMLGKERGYLTYAEVNDHLPDEMLDAEQIESVISMINDMGIQVFDQAPAAEDLLMSETPAPVADEDAAEEAEAALSSVDAEFGRTTDPVRMYMREMGTKDLLTREGEIEIAKRIEEGLKHMVQAISACPLTIVQILELVDKVEKDELKIDDLVDGSWTVPARTSSWRAPLEEMEAAEAEEGDDEDASAAISAANLAQLKDRRPGALRRHPQDPTTRCDRPWRKHGFASKQYQKLLDDVSGMLLGIRFTARQVDSLCDTVRNIVEEVRSHERAIMDLAVNKSGMPRAHFIKTFPGLEGNPNGWPGTGRQGRLCRAADSPPVHHHGAPEQAARPSRRRPASRSRNSRTSTRRCPPARPRRAAPSAR